MTFPPGEICGTPSIDSKGIIYFSTTQNNVYAYDISNGSQRWNVSINDIYVMGKLVDIPIASEDGYNIITEDGLDIII